MPMAICPTNFATLLQIWLFLLSFLPYEPFPVLSTSTTMNEMIMQIDSLVFLFRDCFLSSQIKNLAIILVVVVEALVVINDHGDDIDSVHGVHGVHGGQGGSVVKSQLHPKVLKLKSSDIIWTGVVHTKFQLIWTKDEEVQINPLTEPHHYFREK